MAPWIPRSCTLDNFIIYLFLNKKKLHVYLSSAGRVSLTCVAELDVETIFKHLTRPKGNIFPAPTSPRFTAATPESEWVPRLANSFRVLALYRQEPWAHYRSQVEGDPRLIADNRVARSRSEAGAT